MTGLDKVREQVVLFLRGAGISAVAAWENASQNVGETPVVAVAVQSCESGSAGFLDYLGEGQNPLTGRWEERYGRRMRLTLSLDIYCKKNLGGGALQQGFDALAQALQTAPIPGLSVTGFSRGETKFEAQWGLLHCPAELKCEAYFYAVADEGGQFADFEIKGVKA
ncbi:MAG: hypothetical protein RR336_01505 [Oscillospiraceae bacterium]